MGATCLTAVETLKACRIVGLINRDWVTTSVRGRARAKPDSFESQSDFVRGNFLSDTIERVCWGNAHVVDLIALLFEHDVKVVVSTVFLHGLPDADNLAFLVIVIIASG